MLVALGGALLTAPALAREDVGRTGVTVEGPAFDSRSVAIEHAQAVRREGLRAQVERRYAHDRGWTWHVVVRAHSVDAVEAASVATEATGRPHVVRRDAVLESASRPAALGPAALLLAARDANGDPDAARRLDDEERLYFQYVRQLPDGRRLRHRWARAGERQTASVTDADSGARLVEILVHGDTALRRVDGQDWSPADLHRTRDLLEQLGPHRVLHAALALPRALTERREFVFARPAGSDDRGLRYTYSDPQSERTCSLWLQPDTGRVSAVAVPSADGELVRTFDGAAVDTIVPLPSRIRVEEGETLLDDVRVEVLNSDPPVLDGLEREVGT